MKRIVITTNNINRSGYRILTEGIDMTAFLKNPVMFYDHNTYRLPIGKWADIEIVDGVMTGVPVFDEKDDEALKVKQKYEDGYLNAASLHVRPLEYSENPEHLLAGQKFETITKSEMLEISIVSIPGNAEAVRLSNEAQAPKLLKINTSRMEFKNIALSLGLPETASEADITAAIERINADKVSTLIQSGVDKGLINESNKQHFTTMAQSNYDATKAIVDSYVTQSAAPPVATPPAPSSLMQRIVTAPAATVAPDSDRKEWTFQQWQDKDIKGLVEMRKNNPSEYDRLSQKYYEDKTGRNYDEH